MFTRIFKPKGALPHWLGPAHPHLYSLTLENVYNPFDADAVWDDQYSGSKGITNVEGTSNQRWKRLKNALDDHRVTVPQNDTSGRLLGRSFVYTDVVVWVASQVWLEDMAAGAARIKMLAHNLARNHHRDFESSLYRNRYPNYVVMPSEDLDFTQVRFQFGRGVFIPKPTDQLIAKLNFEVLVKNYDLKDKKQIRPWLFFIDGRRRSERYIGLYEEQQSLLISIDSLLAKDVQSPFQFGDNKGYLLVNQLENKLWECFFAEGKQLNQMARSAKEGGTHFLYPNGNITLEGHAVQFTLNLGVRPLSDADIKKYLKMANIEMDNHSGKPVGISQSRETEDGKKIGIQPKPYKKPEPVQESYAEFGVTIIPGRNSRTLTHTHALVAEGVALPRIDDEYAIDCLQSWSLWLDQHGNPVNNPEIDPQKDNSVTTFSANNKSSKLFYRPSRMAHFVPVDDFPMSVPFGDASIEVVNSPFPEWLALLQFANPFAYALEEGRYLIGRHNPEPDSMQADIQLDQLTHPNSLHWENNQGGGGHRATFTNLGLSRQHAWAEVQDNKLTVNLALGHRIFQFNKALDDGKYVESGIEETLVLEDGDRILVGNYLLRFDSLVQPT